MKTEHYRQCLLTHKAGNAIEQQTSWIPSIFAEIGQSLKLKDKKGTWSDGWLVESTSVLFPAYIVESNERNYLRQRAASDIIFSEIKKENERYEKQKF